MLTHGSFEILRHFQSSKYFEMYQRLRLEAPGWRALNFSGNTMPDEEIERQRAEILRKPLIRSDQENRFFEGLITDETGVVDPQLPILATASSLFEALRLSRSHELVE